MALEIRLELEVEKFFYGQLTRLTNRPGILNLNAETPLENHPFQMTTRDFESRSHLGHNTSIGPKCLLPRLKHSKISYITFLFNILH